MTTLHEPESIAEHDPADVDPVAPSGQPTVVVVGPGERASRNRRSFEVALLVLAVLVLGFSVVTLHRAQRHDADDVARAALRDEVLISARIEIATLNTMDHRDVAGGLEKWQDVTTGTLKDQIASADQQTRDLVAQQRMISTGRVVEAAVTDLTEATATVIAAVETTVRDDSGTPDAPTEPVVRRNRFSASLVRVGDRWLLESLEPVKVSVR